MALLCLIAMYRLKCDGAASCKNCNKKGQPSLYQYTSLEDNNESGTISQSAINGATKEEVITAASRTADMNRHISCLEKMVMFLKHQSSSPGTNHFDQWIEQHTVHVAPSGISPDSMEQNKVKDKRVVRRPGYPVGP